METITNKKYKIQNLRDLTDSTYVVRMNRYGLDFKAGQNLNLGLAGDTEKRDYSIYSGIHDDYLEIPGAYLPGCFLTAKLQYGR